ncbi:hypothetical protein Golob_024167, partial [Gossypium lobatum]|nr:hypothetical protein [Gossypium lobatum]
MAEDINNLLARLKFSEEESTSVVGLRKDSMDDQGYEAWAIGKVLSKDKINREALYRVLKLIWFTKEPASGCGHKRGAGGIGGQYWRDRKGCWIKYIRIRVKTDVSKPLRRVIKMVGLDGIEILCTIQYERYGNWLRVKLDQSKSNVGNWRNGVEFLGGARISSNINAMEGGENEEGDTILQRGKAK